MRRMKLLLLGFTLLVVSVVGVGSLALSQDAAVTGDINCDSDLILVWYIAERYFGFGAAHNTLAQTAADPSAVLDLNRFNRGQFSSLFDALRATQDPNTQALPGVAMSPEALNAVVATMQMDDASFQDFLNSMQLDPAAVTMLVPSGVPGEPPECARLRAQLQRFFAALAFQDMQTGFSSSLGLNTNANANLNANLNDNANINDNTNTNQNTNTNANNNSDDDNSNDNDNDDNSGSGGGDDNSNDNDDDDNSGPDGGDDDDNGNNNDNDDD